MAQIERNEIIRLRYKNQDIPLIDRFDPKNGLTFLELKKKLPELPGLGVLLLMEWECMTELEKHRYAKQLRLFWHTPNERTARLLCAAVAGARAGIALRCT